MFVVGLRPDVFTSVAGGCGFARISDEPVAALRHRFDPSVGSAERAANHPNRARHIGVADIGIGPQFVEQLLTGHQLAASGEQHDQRFEGFRRNRDRLSVTEEATFPRVKGETAEPPHRSLANSPPRFEIFLMFLRGHRHLLR